MLELKYSWVIAAFLVPSIAPSSYAQLDLFTPVDVGLQGFCLENPELRNDPSCARYYKKRNSAPANNSNPSTTRENSSNGSSRRVVAEYECNNPSRLIGTEAIVCNGETIQLPGCSSVQYKQGVYRCFRE